MHARLIVALTVALFAVGVFAESAQAQTYGTDPCAGYAYSSGGYVECVIRYTWPDYEEDFAVYISSCEAGLGADIYNEYSGAYGIFQFLPTTEAGLDGTVYGLLDDPWYASREAAQLQDYAGWSPWACAY